MKITKLEYSKSYNKRNFINIYVDGKFFARIHENSVLELGIAKGDEVSKDKLNEIKEQELYDYLRLKLINFSIRRPHSEKEYKDYLKKSAYSFINSQSQHNLDKKLVDKVITNIIDNLKFNNEINDEEFTRWFVEKRLNSPKPKGKYLIKAELKQKGVNNKVIEKALKDYDNSKEIENLEKVAITKLNQYKRSKANKNVIRQKLFRYLQSRGYNTQDIISVIDSIMSEI